MAITVNKDLLDAADQLSFLAMRCNEANSDDEQWYWTRVKALVNEAIQEES